VVRVKDKRWHELEKGDIPLEKLAQHFESYNRSEGKSPRTIEWYSRVIAYLTRYLKDEGYAAHLSDVDMPVVREFILNLQTKTRWTNHLNMPNPNGNLAAISVQTYVRGLRAFFNWLQREGYTEKP
jgi:site-specific recombinase XerD